MLSHELYLLVTCLVAVSRGIRVDWNTNKGPIVPPTPRTNTRPQPPYRAPAPVWEDQSDDVPNPNPYMYVLPPPSRPRPATNNYLTSDRRPVTQANYDNNYGHIIAPNAGTAYQHQQQQQQQKGHTSNVVVPSLAARYIPNVGIRYYAVVPNTGAKTTTKYSSAAGGGAGQLSGGYFGVAGDKPQGKYNAKTKKYKAHQKEKLKHVPLNYYPLYELALPSAQPYSPVFNQEQLLNTQQLPLATAPQPFRASASSTAAPAATPLQQTSPAKFAHVKDVAEKSRQTVKANNKGQEYANSKQSSPNAISNAAHS